MGRLILIYGVIGGLVVAALGRLVMATMGLEFSIRGMLLGYLTMLIALSVVLVGVKQYRDQFRGGVITFKRAFAVGLAIAAVATVFYVANWELYLLMSDGSFYDRYYIATVEHYRAAGMSGADFAAAVEEARRARDAYQNPLYRIPMTYVTEMLPVGVLVSLITAILLRNPRFLPAKAPIAVSA